MMTHGTSPGTDEKAIDAQDAGKGAVDHGGHATSSGGLGGGAVGGRAGDDCGDGGGEWGLVLFSFFFFIFYRNLKRINSCYSINGSNVFIFIYTYLMSTNFNELTLDWPCETHAGWNNPKGRHVWSADRGRPKLRYKGEVKRDLNKAKIDHTSWETEAADRKVMKSHCKEGGKIAECDRLSYFRLKREKRKAKENEKEKPLTSFNWPKC